MSMKICHEHEYVYRFTGRAIPARPGLVAVSVHFYGSPAKTTPDHAVWKREVHAWGTFQETLLYLRRSTKSCEVCHERNDNPEIVLHPMVVSGESGNLVDPNDELGHLDEFLGVFTPDEEEGLDELITEAVGRGHQEWEKWRRALSGADVMSARVPREGEAS